MKGWDDLEGLLIGCAERDLERCGGVDPVFAAFAGDDLQFLAWLRPFGHGAYADPLIEVLALAMPLRANRLAVCMSGRVWSLDDPIVPVTPEGDLRQRAVILTLVDGAGDEIALTNVMRPFDLDRGTVTWRGRHELPDGQGWIGDALRACLAHPELLPSDSVATRRQLDRLVRLGHDVYLAEDVGSRLGVAAP